MFTGIVTAVGTVRSVETQSEQLKRFVIASPYDAASIAIGASIACSGVCLTATAVKPVVDGAEFTVEAAAETLRLTNVGQWHVGGNMNLERSLKIGDELGGHIVTGHVDGLAELIKVEEMTEAESGWGATRKYTLRAPRALSHFIAKKGSVCLDGTSLTVNEVDGDDFSVLLIPHTIAVTTWKDRKAGDRLHLEVDLMARYAARLSGRS
jgi:riboflavin synthase